LLTTAEEWAKTSRTNKDELKEMVLQIVDAVKHEVKGNDDDPTNRSTTTARQTRQSEPGVRSATASAASEFPNTANSDLPPPSAVPGHGQSLWSQPWWTHPSSSFPTEAGDPASISGGPTDSILSAAASSKSESGDDDGLDSLERSLQKSVDDLVKEPSDSSSRPASSAGVA
jgi:hypothetical protein